MESIKCNKCGVVKSIDSFEYRKDRGSYRHTCKDCRKKINSANYKLKYDLIKDKRNEARRKKYSENKKAINEKRRKIYNQNKDTINAKRREKRTKEMDPIKNLRQQVYNAVLKSYERKGFVRTKSIEEILGCSLEEKVDRMLELYKYSYKKEYENKEKICVDHIIPIWTAKTVEELDDCNHMIQFLPESENIRKGGRISDGIGRNGRIKYVCVDPDIFD